MTEVSLPETIRKWMGWCPNAPAVRTAPAVLVLPQVTVHPAQPDSGSAGGQRPIRLGIGFALESIKTLIREKHLLWFSLLAGLVICFLIFAEGWNITHDNSILPSVIWIPLGEAGLIVFDSRLFIIEAICLTGFTLLLAGLVLYRNGSHTKKPLTIREGFAGINHHTGTLAGLSIVMAVVATILFEITSQSRFFGTIESGISMAMFHLPYAYYFAPDRIFSALFFSFRIMVINIVLFLLLFYIVPVIMLEKKRLSSALAGSVSLMRKTWREMLGLGLVFGIIVLAVAAIGLLIGQSPLLLNHDYDFFLQMTRGRILMTVACYGFLTACGILTALGSTVLGIAITDMYDYGKTGRIAGDI